MVVFYSFYPSFVGDSKAMSFSLYIPTYNSARIIYTYYRVTGYGSNTWKHGTLILHLLKMKPQDFHE